MPELPEVETVVREVRPHVVDRVIAAVRVSAHALRQPWSPAWNRALTGQRILGVERRGKWIFVPLAGGRTLVIHLGMTGQLTVVPARRPLQPHTHVVFGLRGTERQLHLHLGQPASVKLSQTQFAFDPRVAKFHLPGYDSTTSAVSSTAGAATGFFVRVVVITTTLTRTSRVPRIVRRPRDSPPRKYPTRTATTGFTYA